MNVSDAIRLKRAVREFQPVPLETDHIHAILNAGRRALGKSEIVPPAATAHGALITHLTQSDPNHFQPSNVNFGLFPPLEKKLRKRDRGRLRAELALAQIDQWRQALAGA